MAKSCEVGQGHFEAPCIREAGVKIEVLPPVARRWPDGGPLVEYRVRPSTHIQRRPDGGPTVEYRLRPATHIQRRPDVVVLSGAYVAITLSLEAYICLQYITVC